MRAAASPARVWLRPTTAADLPALTRIANAERDRRLLAPDWIPGCVPGPQPHGGPGRSTPDHRCLTVVERSTGRVLGLAVLRPPGPVDEAPWISALVIDPGCRGQGLGTEVACRLERIAGRAGWATVRLSVLADSPRALRFWKRLGYREVPGSWRAYNGSAVGTVTLQRRVGDVEARRTAARAGEDHPPERVGPPGRPAPGAGDHLRCPRPTSGRSMR